MATALAFIFLLSFAPAQQAVGAQIRASSPQSGQTVDAIAVRIEDDIITESEVRELARFQQLVDGHAEARDKVVRELVDQWIVRNEANTTKYPEPSTDDVQREYEHLESQFHSPQEFTQKCAAAGLSEAAVRRLLEQQLFLARFLDYRFRPTAQVSPEDIQSYYEKEFAPQLKARNENVPPVDAVADTIREVLTQRTISQSSDKWLDETRGTLRVDISAEPKP